MTVPGPCGPYCKGGRLQQIVTVDFLVVANVLNDLVSATDEQALLPLEYLILATPRELVIVVNQKYFHRDVFGKRRPTPGTFAAIETTGLKPSRLLPLRFSRTP